MKCLTCGKSISTSGGCLNEVCPECVNFIKQPPSRPPENPGDCADKVIEYERVRKAAAEYVILELQKALENSKPPVLNVSVAVPTVTREEVWLRVVCATVRIEKVTMGTAIRCGNEAVTSFDKKFGVVKL